jgi:hypothetical protein
MIRLAILALLFAPATVLDRFESSGRIVGIADRPSDRLNGRSFNGLPLLAPGAPPVLSFRYFDASERGRFGNLGLMTDDAGH